MSNDLKPCPFCGCAATFVKHSAGMPGTQGHDKWDAVACKHCRATVGACDRRFRERDDAAKAWNLRAPDARPAQPVAGWVILHKDGTVADFKARLADFFGSVVENEPFTAAEVAYMDREWPGLAPHRIVALHAAPSA